MSLYSDKNKEEKRYNKDYVDNYVTKTNNC